MKRNATFQFTCFAFLCLIFSYTTSWAQHWQRDSLRIDSMYQVAVRFSDTDPPRTKGELEKIVATIDSSLIGTYGDLRYLLEKKAASIHFLGYYERRENNYDGAFKRYIQSIELHKQLQDSVFVIKGLTQMGVLWVYQEQYEKAESCYKQALALSEKYQLPKETLLVLSNLGTLYSNTKEKIKAESSHKGAIVLADSINNKQMIATTNANYAAFLRQHGRFQENLPYLQKSIDLHRELNNQIGLESGIFAMGVTFRKLGLPRRAIPFFEEAIELSKLLDSEALIPTRYLGLSNAYGDLGDTVHAFHYYISYKKALDRRKDLETINELNKLQTEFEIKQKRAMDSIRFEEKRIASINEVKLESQKKFWIVVTILSILIALFLVIYFLNRERIQRQKAKNEALSHSVIKKTEEIEDLLIETAQQIKHKENITRKLQQLSKGEKGISVQTILSDLRSMKSDDTKMLLIKDNIQQANRSFLKSIKKEFPALTPADLELCSLIRIGLSRKEAASLRNTTLEAVKKGRYRLKKKFNLTRLDSLDDFIKYL